MKFKATRGLYHYYTKEYDLALRTVAPYAELLPTIESCLFTWVFIYQVIFEICINMVLGGFQGGNGKREVVPHRVLQTMITVFFHSFFFF